jgi:Xaa-Pro dipeptidase
MPMTRRKEVEAKHASVVACLDAAGLDAVVLTQRWNFAWYTAGGQNYVNHASDTGAASLVVSKAGAWCVTSNIEGTRLAREELEDTGVNVVPCDWWDAAKAAKAFAEVLDGKQYAADVKVAGLPDGGQALPGDFDKLRLVLNEAEIERYRKIGKATGEALEAVCRAFAPGGTEYELAGMVSQAMWSRQLKPHVVLAAGDDRLDLWRHPIPTGLPVHRRAMAVVCAEQAGLIASATRLFSFGEPEAPWRHRQKAVCRIDAVMMDRSRPGRTLGEVFAAAQKAYADAGFPDGWRDHHQGGPTGYRTRERRATPGNPAPILAHQAFAWNPSLVAAKSEDTILTTDAGFEILTATGEWPSVRVDLGGTVIERPDILVRGA